MLKPLLSLECKNILGINTLLHTEKKDSCHKHTVMNLSAYLLLMAVLSSMLTGQTQMLLKTQAAHLTPEILLHAGAALSFCWSLYFLGQTLFSCKGLDMLKSLPVTSGEIALARLLCQYFQIVLLTVILLLPAELLYGIETGETLFGYAKMLAVMVVLPLIPVSASALIQTLLLSFALKTKHPKAVQILSSLALTLSFFLLPLLEPSLEILNQDTEQIISQLDQLLTAFLWYIPAKWAVMGGTSGFLIFFGVSLGILIGTAFIICLNFDRICTGLWKSRENHTFKLGNPQKSSLCRALYMRECRRYFASPVYVSNTIIGPILSLAGAISLPFLDFSKIESIMPVSVTCLLPLIWTSICCMMSTCSVSVTMEKKHIWQMQTLPVSSEIWLNSKLLWGLSLMLPCWLVFESVMTFLYQPGWQEFLWQMLMPLALMIFTCIFGLWVDLHFHNFSFEKDEEAVKQSLSSLVGGLAGTLLGLILCGVVFLTGGNLAARWISFGCVAILSLFLYIRNGKTKMEHL